MTTNDKRLSSEQIAAARQRWREAIRLQEIESNPLDAEQIAMFQMFEQENWSEERIAEHLLMRGRAAALK